MPTLSERLQTAFATVGTDMRKLQKRWGDTPEVPPSNNLDNVAEAGQYSVNAAVISGTPSLGTLQGVMSGSVVVHVQYSPVNAAQTLYTHPAGDVYTRINDGGVWTDWREVRQSTPEDNTVRKGGDVRVAGPGDTGNNKQRHVKITDASFYTASTQASTGAFVLHLPGAGENTFYSGVITFVRNYRTAVQVRFNGYYKADGLWANTRFSSEDTDVVRYVLYGKDASGEPVLVFGNDNAGDPVTSMWRYYIKVSLDEVTVGWSGSETAAARDPDNYMITLDSDLSGYTLEGEKRVEPALAGVLRRRYVDVADYVPSSDLANAFDGIQAAFNDGYGREIVFSNPRGGTRKYICNDRADGTLIMPRQARLIWDDGAQTRCEWSTAPGQVGKTFMKADGTYTGFKALTTPASKGALSLHTLSDWSAAYPAPCWAYVYSQDDFTTQEGSLGKRGEWVYVVGYTGTEVHLATPLVDTYTTSAQIKFEDEHCSIVLDNPQLVGSGFMQGNIPESSLGAGDGTNVDGDEGIEIFDANRVVVNGGDIRHFDKHGLSLVSCRQWAIRDTHVLIDPVTTLCNPTQYPIVIYNGTQSGIAENVVTDGGREAFALSSTGDSLGPTRNVTISGGISRNARRSGFATHDNHENIRVTGRRFENCEQYIDARIQSMTIDNCYGVGAGYWSAQGLQAGLDCAVQIGSGGGKLSIHDNVWEDVLRGYWSPATISHEVAPGAITIKNDVVRSATATHGVLFEYDLTNNADVPLGHIEIDIDFETAAANSCAVELNGQWDNPVIRGRAVNTSGNGAGVVLLTADASNSGVGPANPDVDIRFKGFNYPVVQYETGVYKEKLTQIDGYARGESFTVNEYHNFGSISGGGYSSHVVNITDAEVGDFVAVATDVSAGGLVYHGEVQSAGSVRIWAHNITGGTINASGGQYYITITKRA